MPITTYPLPVNPTTGQAPFSYTSPRFGPPPPTAAGSGVVSKETLKALQDVVWDDDEDDPDCILCAEPLDLADQNFKPCQCGMQICQFCYNKLLSTDPRCPGCRRPYDVKSVEFHPVDWEEVKRAKEKKARKAKTIKQLDGLGRRHLLDVRIIMRNTVFVTGMKLPAPGDEAIPILRTNEYFGQYGKIQRLHLKERPSSDEPGIFIVFVRREDAARAIAALDGVAAPGGPPGTVLKATYGTTHYCDSFLRGQKCDTIGCTGLHEWGGENDTFTKDDMETAILRPAQYDARQKQAQHQLPNLSIKSQWPKPSAEEVVGSAGLPSSASWGKHIGAGRAQQPGRNGVVAPGPGAVARPGKPPAVVSLTKNPAAFPLPTPSPLPITIVKEKRKANAANAQANAVGAATGTAMARGRSTDSAQSGSGTTSSAQTSPKKRGTNLPSAVATPSKVVTGSGQAAPPAPPPGLATTSATPSKAAAKKVAASAPPSNVPEPDDVPETTSNESEAGPSSSSPAPQTPSAINGDALYPPPPLTADPIFLHTPYEEPDLELFPMSDPDFRYSLDLDEEEIRRYASEAGGYTPSPFDKMLVGLAELGVLARDVDVLDEIAGAHPGKRISWHGNFQPFDANPLEALKANDTGSGMTDSDHAQMYGQQSYGAGPSSRRTSVDHDGPRTASRFDFARPPSAGASSIMSARTSMTNMHSSPFAILQRRTQMAEEMGAMSPQYQLHLQQQQQQQLQHQEQQRQQQHQQQLQQVLQQQLRNTGTFSAPPGFGNMGPQEQHSNQGDMGSWAAESSNMASASNARQSPSYGKMTSRDGRQYGMGGKRAPDMDEYDPALAYPPASSRSTFRTLFSPEHDNPNLPRHASPSNAYHSHAAQSTQPQSTPGPAGQTRTPVYAMDARTLQQYHAMRAVSPTPASTGLGGGYARRY